MSRVTLTELVDGALATSTDVNGTLNSWNTATSAGGLDGTNCREEGIDRGVLAQHVANTQRQTSTPQLTSAAAFAPGAFPAYLDFGAGVTTIGPVTVSTGDRLLVCYTTWATDVNNSILRTRLFADSGAGYALVTGTTRRKRCRAAGAAPRATGSLSAKVVVSTAGTYSFRVECQGSAAASFRYSSFWVESLAT